jgi:integrase
VSQIAWAEELPAIPLPFGPDPVYPVDQAPSPKDSIPLFGDDVWPVRFFSNNPSMQNVQIHWRTFPQQYVEHFRLAVWALFNVPVPHELLAQRAGPMVSTLSALRIYHNAVDYRMLGRWLEARGVEAVSDLTPMVMADYAEHLRTDRRVARGTAVNHLTAITRLWVVGLQIPQLALAGIPPWVTGRIDDYLPPASGARGENDTEPIATATISALLNVAIRFIETGTEPILKAVALDQAIYDHARTNKGAGERSGAGTLRAYLNDLRVNGAPLPMKVHNARRAVDNTYIAYATGVSLNSVYNWSRSPEVRAYAETHGAPTTVELIENDLLPASIPLTAVQTYVNLLQAACFTVIAYLTGMRPGEALALETGSLRPSSRNGGWMLLNSRTFKTARDEDGNHDSNGHLRPAPWVAVAPVVKAIQALERLVGEGLLFPSHQHVKNAGRSVGLTTIADAISRFISYANDRKQGTIPDDPAGRVTPIRFRRTLAWHIANQPGGLVALAIQYGHLRTAISEGYASRVRDGIHDMVDFETARAIAIRLTEAADAMDNGEGVSGPAALRFVTAVREQSAEFNGIVTSRRQARSLLNNSSLTVFQNDDAFVWCNFNRDTALCLTPQDVDDAPTPRLDRCKPNCLNVARTDSQARGLRRLADQFRREAAVMPKPCAERLLASAVDFEGRAEQHDRDRRTSGDFDVCK